MYSFDQRVSALKSWTPFIFRFDTRSYEEHSLGIFEAPVGDLQEDLEQLPSRERIGRYVHWHLRRQLSIGMLFTERHFYIPALFDYIVLGNRHLVVGVGDFHCRNHRAWESNG